MAAEPIIEELLTGEPNLTLVPDWMPTPDPPMELPILEPHGHWRNVWDWVKEHAILPHGKPIEDPFGVIETSTAIAEAYAGETIKALSGFMNRATAMTVEAASLLDDALNNEYENRISDFRDLSQRLDRIENVQNYIVSQVIPAVEAQFVAADHRALVYALSAAQAQQQWTETHVLTPLVESLGQLNHDLRQVIDLKAEESHQISASQVAGLGATLLPMITGAVAQAKSVAQWVDECGAPMCETMGPKTDLGKFLKGLKIAATLALLAELANLDEHGVENLVRGFQHLAGGMIDTFDQLFVGSGSTLGDVISHVGG